MANEIGVKEMALVCPNPNCRGQLIEVTEGIVCVGPVTHLECRSCRTIYEKGSVSPLPPDKEILS